MSELYHYGVKGQRWGVRRYQNEDGTYTAEGKAWRMKQAGRIQKQSHGTGNVRSAKRNFARERLIKGALAYPGGMAIGAGIGAIATAGNPVGIGTGAWIGGLVGMGTAFVNAVNVKRTLDDIQDYAESSKKYSDIIMSTPGVADLKVSDLKNKK